MLKKLIPETCASRLVVVLVNLVQVFSGTSFLHTIEHSSIPTQELSGMWHKPCNVIGQPVVFVQETVMNLCQIFHASFMCNCLAQVSGTGFLSVCRRV